MSPRIYRRLRQAKWQAYDTLAHWRRAWRYAIGTIEGRDAERMLYDAEHAVERFCLESISADDVADRLLDEFNDGLELRYAARYAAGRVASKWESTGDEASAAIDWAYDIATASCKMFKRPSEEVEA